MAEKDPSKFCIMVANLLPKEMDLSITTELGQSTKDFLQAYRLIGAAPDKCLLEGKPLSDDLFKGWRPQEILAWHHKTRGEEFTRKVLDMHSSVAAKESFEADAKEFQAMGLHSLAAILTEYAEKAKPEDDYSFFLKSPYYKPKNNPDPYYYSYERFLENNASLRKRKATE
jgi:hypothetical protein